MASAGASAEARERRPWRRDGGESHIDAMSDAIFPIAPDTHDLERGTVLAPGFNADGLIAAVATDAGSGEVLMLAWMNAEALKLTLETGEAHYFSRSRQSLWKKGETSGQIQAVREIRIDCDQDAVWLKVAVGGDGGACHIGFRSCFYRVVEDGALVERP
jgi:phosphoribosyl-AMP cyclohydrolase